MLTSYRRPVCMDAGCTEHKEIKDTGIGLHRMNQVTVKVKDISDSFIPI